MNSLVDEQIAITYGEHNVCAELYTWISQDICEKCIKDGKIHCQTCEIIPVKERITDILCRQY